MAFLPVLSSPACSGIPDSYGFSSPIWFTPLAMGSPLWGRDWFVLDRNEGSCVSLSLLGLFLHVVTALGVLVTIWVSVLLGSRLCAPAFFPVTCFGYMSAFMALTQGLKLSLVPYPSSFLMEFVPLSDAPLSALQLTALPSWWS